MTQSFFKYFGCVDEICLLPHRVMDLEQMTLDLEREKDTFGRKINTNYTKAKSKQIIRFCGKKTLLKSVGLSFCIFLKYGYTY